jgi:HSP20 family molecular chaperone IbpA
MSLFNPRYVVNEFAPLFRLMDDLQTISRSSYGSSFGNNQQSWQPRFDVKENKDAYELHGELPGLSQENLTVEFTDPQTLQIKGRTERHHEEGTRPAQLEAGQTQQAIEQGESDTSSSYHKPTVQDENTSEATGATMSGGNPDAATPAETSKEGSVVAQPATNERPRYWVSERSVGEFFRTFSFPSRVDQENVKASLKDGILSIIVPKASAPQSRRINIE